MDITQYSESKYVKIDLIRNSPTKEIVFTDAGKEVEDREGTYT